MLRTVSVETGLNEIKEYLTACGYEVVDMADCIRPVEAVIYTGAQLTRQPAVHRLAENTVMINAAGLTAQQIGQALNNM